MIDLEILFARYCFEVTMLSRCLDADRPIAPYLERANHLLRQVVGQLRIVSELPREEAESLLGEMLAFDPDLALDQVMRHMERHGQCLKLLERECLASTSRLAERYDLTAPGCLELVATSHQVLDYARGVLWAVQTFGLVD